MDKRYKSRLESTQILYQIWMDRDKLGKKIELLKKPKKWLKEKEIKTVFRLVNGVFYSYKILDRIIEPYLSQPEKEMPIPLKVVLYLGIYEIIFFKQEYETMFKDYKNILALIFEDNKDKFIYSIFSKFV